MVERSGRLLARLRGSRGMAWRQQVALPALAALAAGLYLARLWAESRPQAWRFSQLAALVACAVALAAAGVILLQIGRRQTWPLLLLGAYALWPQADSHLALAVGVVSLVAFALAQPRLAGVPELPGYLFDLLVGGVALLLYILTLAPSVQPADAGEFQLVASVLGIAHPPGYPLYTMLGKLFTLLPWGDPAWRVNLFAAVCAAATLVVVSRTVRRATGSVAAGLVAALALGLVPTFWSQATLANGRSLTALFTALSFYWLLRYGETRALRDLVVFAVTFGLGAGHHSSFVLLGLPFLAYLLAVDPRLFMQPRRWPAPIAGLLGTLLVLAYLPLRSAMNPPFDAPAVRTLSGFVDHVLALGFQGDFLYFLRQPTLALRFRILADIFNIEFGLGLWLGALALGLLSARRRWQWALLWGGVALVNGFAAITYRAPQTVEYLLPTYVALALGLGLGLGTVLHDWPGRPAPALLAGLVAWLALSNGLAAYPSYLALHRDDAPRREAVELLQAAPPGALILSNWHQATPLWYLQRVEGLRPDVKVIYVYPEGATPNGEVWLRQIQGAVDKPVIVTNRFPQFAGASLRFSPVGVAWAVEAGASRSLPAGLTGKAQTLGDKIEFLGAQLPAVEAAPGRDINLQIAWRPRTGLERSYSWFVQLVGPQGVAGQADERYEPGRAAAGENVVDGYRLSLRPDTAPGDYQLIAGVYITFPDGGWERLRTPDGQDAITLGQVHVRPRREPPASAHPLDLAWSDGSRLVGVDYDDSLPGARRMYLHWYRPAGATDLDVTVTAWKQPDPVQMRVPGASEGGYQTVSCDLSPEAGLASLKATAGERPVLALGAWHRAIMADWPARGPALGARYLDLGGEMVLVGARWQPQEPAAGALLAAEFEFLASRPLLRDYTVSLSLEGEGWSAQDDGTPALGAIPTLKWLASWRIRDIRRLAVPAGATGPARLRLAVYDAFTLAQLPVGDDRMAKAGQGTQIILWEGTVR